MPKGRDLTNAKWLETLLTATTTVAEDNAQAQTLAGYSVNSIKFSPIPLVFETNEDMVWSKNQKGRLCVHFNGLSDLIFEVYCGNRQLHWFQRFLEDQQTKRKSKKSAF